MTIRIALELNDAGITAVGDSGELFPGSPGFALLENGALLLGRAAARRARLEPRLTHTRFWDLLDTSPLRRPLPTQLRAADLVHAHLQHLWRKIGADVTEVILAVPGCWSGKQLSLLLGVARAAAVPVTGLVDAGVAAVMDQHRAPGLAHLELHLHRAVLTTIVCNGSVWRQRATTSDRVGLLPLTDAWARSTAALFVRSTRFDPLHLAETEQALYDKLPSWLGDFHQEEVVTASLEAGGRNHRFGLSREQIVTTARAEYDHLARLVESHAEPTTAALLLGARAAALPGLKHHLCAETGLEVIALPPAAAAAGAWRYALQISRPGEVELPLITHLDATQAPHGKA